MIRWLTTHDVERYAAKGDPLGAMLGDPRAAGTTGERWLCESLPKRAASWAVYGPLLRERGLRILDIGSGYSSLSYALASRHDYTAIDIGAHGGPPEGIRAVVGDWYELELDRPDVVVAVDLLPNVDQRLAAFLERWRGVPAVLTVTTYADRWYRTRRVDGDEVLTVAAWTWEQADAVLRAHGLKGGPPPPDDLFGNGRQVCIVDW